MKYKFAVKMIILFIEKTKAQQQCGDGKNIE
jgi:hypothetical protein